MSTIDGFSISSAQPPASLRSLAAAFGPKRSAGDASAANKSLAEQPLSPLEQVKRAAQEGLALTDRSMHTDVARALNDTSILVTIPPQERVNIPQFIAMVMSTQVTLSLLQQPAEVRINARTGSIIISGNVEISPVAISHKNLMISTVTPSLPPTLQNPQRFRETMVGLDTSSRAREKARIQDLIAAFKTLDVPVDDRINIIMQLHKAGRLHAKLVVE